MKLPLSSLAQQPAHHSLSHSLSTNTTTSSNNPHSATTTQTEQSLNNSAYLDPYTTLPEGYQPRTTRWRLLIAKLQAFKSRKTADPEAAALAALDQNVANLTERNLTEFFNPEYSDEVQLIRENPYDNSRKRERVGSWLENLPEGA
jgi:hypothetical protein